MGRPHAFRPRDAMASPWRRRPVCLLVAGETGPAALSHLSGRGAFVQTDDRPALGATVTLRHPDAGAIEARVIGVQEGGLALRFHLGPASVAWALVALAADMSRPAQDGTSG